MNTKHGFADGQQVMLRVGSDMYAVTIEKVTRMTAVVAGSRFFWSRGRLRGKGVLFALRPGDEWVTRLDPCF